MIFKLLNFCQHLVERGTVDRDASGGALFIYARE